MGMRVAIIIPVFQGGSAFSACLASVAAAVRAQDEIIVVADSEGDGSWQIAPDYGAKVVKLDTNSGPSCARNLGAKEAQSEILFFVDADVTIPPNAVSMIESIFEQQEDLAAVIGSYDEFPAQRNFVSQFKNLLHHYVHQRGSKEAFTFWGACGAIRRDVFLAVGGFDEFFRVPSIEDVELGYRLVRAHYKIRLTKELQITHLKRWEAHSLIKTDLLCRAIPWTRLIWSQLWKTGKVASDLNLDIAHRLSLLTSASLVLAALLSLVTWWGLVVATALIAVFLFLNQPLLKFFHSKRGGWFALRAAFWRFGYDLYSLAGFICGSSYSAHIAFRKLALLTFAALDPLALGVACGVTSGAAFLGLTCYLAANNGERIRPTVELLGQYLPGYTVDWVGSLIGLLYGLLVGFIFGFSLACIRNLAVMISLGSDKVRSAYLRAIENR